MSEIFHFFWRGSLSQWYMRDITVDGRVYNCCEQFMMASKARFFNDEETWQKIMESYSPREQKALGRAVKNFNETAWNNVAKEFVKKANIAKFTQHEDLKILLLATEGELVEASPYDQRWGIGLEESDPKAKSRETWRGLNWLGEVLTDVRETIKCMD